MSESLEPQEQEEDIQDMIRCYFEDYKMAQDLCHLAIESPEEKTMFENILETLESTEKVINEWENLPEKT